MNQCLQIKQTNISTTALLETTTLNHMKILAGYLSKVANNLKTRHLTWKRNDSNLRFSQSARARCYLAHLRNSNKTVSFLRILRGACQKRVTQKNDAICKSWKSVYKAPLRHLLTPKEELRDQKILSKKILIVKKRCMRLIHFKVMVVSSKSSATKRKEL